MIIQEFAEKIEKETGAILCIAGGFVRDELLGKQSKDIDCEIYHISVSDFTSFLVENGIEYAIDFQAKFPVFRMELEGEEIEIGFPRRDNKTGHKHNDFEIEIDPNMSFEEATKRRDFTCNAILKTFNKEYNNYIDPQNGASDIANNILRPVDTVTFKEDPLRLFRAFNFIARFGFDYSEILKIIDDDFLAETKHISKDSIFKEIAKGVKFGTPENIVKGLDFLKESGLLRVHFPELDILSDCQQSLKHHAEGDVWTHTKMVVLQAMRMF